MFPGYTHSFICLQEGLRSCINYTASSTAIQVTTSTGTSAFAFTDTNLLFMIAVLTFFTIIQTILIYTKYNK